jgi:hypothetical protein
VSSLVILLLHPFNWAHPTPLLRSGTSAAQRTPEISTTARDMISTLDRIMRPWIVLATVLLLLPLGAFGQSQESPSDSPDYDCEECVPAGNDLNPIITMPQNRASAVDVFDNSTLVSHNLAVASHPAAGSLAAVGRRNPLYNYLGHPIQGALTSYIEIQ